MTLADKQATVSRLVTEFGYPVQGAQIVAEKLACLQPTLAELAETWWVSGAAIPLSVEGYSIESLKNDRGMNDIAAILSLDWLLRDREAAKQALEQGHDHIK